MTDPGAPVFPDEQVLADAARWLAQTSDTTARAEHGPAAALETSADPLIREVAAQLSSRSVLSDPTVLRPAVEILARSQNPDDIDAAFTLTLLLAPQLRMPPDFFEPVQGQETLRYLLSSTSNREPTEKELRTLQAVERAAEYTGAAPTLLTRDPSLHQFAIDSGICPSQLAAPARTITMPRPGVTARRDRSRTR